MISFNLHIASEMMRNQNYSLHRSSGIYCYLKNEYRGMNEDGYAYVLSNGEPRKSFLKSAIEKMPRKDASVKIKMGSEEHTFFETEYNHLLAKDNDSNIIIPEDYIYQKRI